MGRRAAGAAARGASPGARSIASRRACDWRSSTSASPGSRTSSAVSKAAVAGVDRQVTGPAPDQPQPLVAGGRGEPAGQGAGLAQAVEVLDQAQPHGLVDVVGIGRRETEPADHRGHQGEVAVHEGVPGGGVPGARCRRRAAPPREVGASASPPRSLAPTPQTFMTYRRTDPPPGYIAFAPRVGTPRWHRPTRLGNRRSPLRTRSYPRPSSGCLSGSRSPRRDPPHPESTTHERNHHVHSTTSRRSRYVGSRRRHRHHRRDHLRRRRVRHRDGDRTTWNRPLRPPRPPRPSRHRTPPTSADAARAPGAARSAGAGRGTPRGRRTSAPAATASQQAAQPPATGARSPSPEPRTPTTGRPPAPRGAVPCLGAHWLT